MPGVNAGEPRREEAAMGLMLGKGVGHLVAGLLKTVVGIIPGLLGGLASPITSAVQRRRRISRRHRDVRSVKRDWRALRKGKGPGKATKRTRRRLKKRLA
jgi:hypothetical protein